MAELSFFVGILGNVISLLVFCSPITTFKRVVKKRSTESFKGEPYVTTLLSTSLWTYYGLLKPDGLLVVTINGAGSAMQAVYVLLYIIYSTRDAKVRMARLVAVLNIGCYGAAVLITMLALRGNIRLLVVGLLCAGLTVGMYASPLTAMRTVFKTKSVEYMPFLLSFFLFLNGGVWSAYSVLVKDYFIGVPNAIGFILGTAQLALYAMYRNKTPKPPPPPAKGTEDEEEGSAHLVKRVVDLEMQTGGYDDEDPPQLNHNNLSKTGSLTLPKSTSISRQHSLAKIVKSHSSTPYDLHSMLQPLHK